MARRDLKKLVKHLAVEAQGGYTLVTWNGLGFDFDILAEESGMLEECKRLALDHVDMMFHVLCQLGHGVSFDAAARGMNLPGKRRGTSGALVPEMWAKGKYAEVLDYVAHDARTTLDLARACEKRGALRWITRRGTFREMMLTKGWLVVQLAQKLPKPDTNGASRPWSRTRLDAWLS
jgi:hypothetical protein